MRTVWVDDWQVQCCGEPFAVGDRIVWSVRPPDEEYMDAVLGRALPAGVDCREEHHDDPDADDKRLTGSVAAIQAVFCRFAPAAGKPASPLHLVPGSAVMQERSTAAGWERPMADLRFIGYVVSIAGAAPGG